MPQGMSVGGVRRPAHEPHDRPVATGAGAAGEPAGDRPGRDVLTWLVGGVALVVYTLHGFNGVLSRDLAIYAYGAQHAAEGIPPYVAIFERTGPLAQLVPAVGVVAARILGIDDLLGMRILFMLLSVGCVVLVYVLARTVFGSRVTGLAAAAAFLTFKAFIDLATTGPREKTTMVLLLTLMVLALAKRKWWLAAAAASLATLTWQPAAFVCIVSLMAPLIGLRGADRRRAVGEMVIGGVVPVLATLAYFASMGAVRDLLDGFILVHLDYTVKRPFQTGPLGIWRGTKEGFGLSAWLIPIGLAGLVFAAALRARRAGPRGATLDPVVLAALSVIPAIGFTLYDFDRYPDAFVLLPFAALGLAFLFHEVVSRLPTGTWRGLAAVGWIGVALAVAVIYSVSNRDSMLDRQRASVAHVLQQLPPDATIMSVQAPHALVLAQKTNPTRHQMFDNGLTRYIDDTWPGGLTGFVDWVDRTEPTAIVWSGFYSGKAGGLRALVEQKYEKVGRVRGWIWYVHRDLDVDIDQQVWRK